MSAPPTPSEPACYQVCLGALLDDRWASWFDGLSLTREDDGTTTLRGVVADQAELHGLLAKVRDLGVTLISVTREPRPPSVPPARPGA